MTTKVEKTIEVQVPLTMAYDQWTQFEEFPQFMKGVDEVKQTSAETTHWKASILGVSREWDATITEQVPDKKVAWAATKGATNTGAVTFDRIDDSTTRVNLALEMEPEGFVEKAGDKLGVIGDQAEGDLKRFKKFIEGRSQETGAWRGGIQDGTTASDEATASAGPYTPAATSMAADTPIDPAAATTPTFSSAEESNSETEDMQGLDQNYAGTNNPSSESDTTAR